MQIKRLVITQTLRKACKFCCSTVGILNPNIDVRVYKLPDQVRLFNEFPDQVRLFSALGDLE